MAQPTTTPKIEELRAKLKADPKSRQFFPLAEELRKIDRFDDAEKVLRDGLAIHPTYLSAWISLGRVLHEAGKYKPATEVLEKALTLDQGNVVAAKLLGESYLALGEKVAAIKKFKLVNALHPNDEETEAHIDRLDRELNPEKYGVVPAAAPAASAPAPATPDTPPAAAAPGALASEPAVVPEPPPPAPPPPAQSSAAETDDVFSQSAITKPQELLQSSEAEDVFAAAESTPTPPAEEPKPARPSPEETSPFQPAPKFALPEEGAENVWSEPSTPQQPEETGSPFDDLPPAPPSASLVPKFEMAEPIPFEPEPVPFTPEPIPFTPEPLPFTPAEPPVSERSVPQLELVPEPKRTEEDLTTTITMADLYARQGHYDQAREIYERMLERDPGNRELRQKLDVLPGAAPPASAPAADSTRTQAVTRLESWLSKVKKDDRV
jgi:pentatricopeptide repeat protein